ncbi:hypothetical protein [Streptomyces odonnellii]|uniref:hypothetical protein n=1 Tax=Streptomyces odonnellii TaxID=1417980 RepID=UPI0006987A47|nr:hypothetical protein [Streptomyces odonnellii]
MPHYALEVTLTRAVTRAELDRAVGVFQLAASHDRTRLMAVVKARTPQRALHRARHALDSLLPIDILCTHYPDGDGRILINVSFTPAEYTWIRQAAARAGQSPNAYLRCAVTQTLERTDREAAERLDTALAQLLTNTTPEQLLTATARTITTTQRAHTC